MTKFILLLFIAYGVQCFGQLKQINPGDLKSLELKDYYHMGDGNFSRMRGHVPYISTEFETIELDTISKSIHMKGRIIYRVIQDDNLSIEINVAKIILEKGNDSLLNYTTMNFFEKFNSNADGYFDFTFIITDKDILVCFNEKERESRITQIKIAKIYRIGKLIE